MNLHLRRYYRFLESD